VDRAYRCLCGPAMWPESRVGAGWPSALKCSSSLCQSGWPGRQHPGAELRHWESWATKDLTAWFRSTSICAPAHHRKALACRTLPTGARGPLLPGMWRPMALSARDDLIPWENVEAPTHGLGGSHSWKDCRRQRHLTEDGAARHHQNTLAGVDFSSKWAEARLMEC